MEPIQTFIPLTKLYYQVAVCQYLLSWLSTTMTLSASVENIFYWLECGILYKGVQILCVLHYSVPLFRIFESLVGIPPPLTAMF